MRYLEQPASLSSPRLAILDTDMGNDIDDALALALIHALESMGECRLLGVAINKPNASAMTYTNLVNTFYGRGGIPLAQIGPHGPVPDLEVFAQAVSMMTLDDGQPMFPRTPAAETGLSPETLMRKLLSEAQRPVTIISIGFLSNLAALLDSPPDAYSPLTGSQLIEAKVDTLAVMAGHFSPEALANPSPQWAEWNVVKDIPSAQRVAHHWPGQIVFLGYEVGLAVRYPYQSILDDYHWTEHHPIEQGYHLWSAKPHDRPCWDPLAALYAIRPASPDFSLSQPGRVEIDAHGYVHFHTEAAGLHHYLIADESQQQRLRDTIVQLCARPTDALMSAAVEPSR